MGLKALVSTRIREARRQADFTQKVAAEHFSKLVGRKVKQTTWASWETGSVNVPLDTIDELARFFGQPSEFFTNPNYEYMVKASKPEEPPKKARRRREAAHEPALR